MSHKDPIVRAKYAHNNYMKNRKRRIRQTRQYQRRRKVYIQVYMKEYNPRYRKTHAHVIKANRQQRKLDAIAYKGGQCQECGYKKCPAALTFHHRNPEEKEYQIAVMLAWSWARIVQELDKCDLLCANCHFELEWEKDNK